jgi:hypothetical protein
MKSFTLDEMNSHNENNQSQYYSIMKKGDFYPSTSMLICGDLFLDERNNDHGGDAENKFKETIKEIIKNTDISLVNLESSTTLSNNKIIKSGPNLKMNPLVLSLIKQTGFDAVTLANNHIMDFGSEGLFDTISCAQSLGLLMCGAGKNIHEAIQPIIFQRQDGLRIAVFSFCEKEFGVADENTPGSAWISDPLALLEIKKYRDSADFILIIAHGGLEHVPLSPLERQTQLRNFIDAGADMVIGHHPHVVQGWENYHGKYIFYSLGNLIFDIFRVVHQPATDWGFMIRLQFDSKILVGIDLFFTEQTCGNVQLMENRNSLNNRIEYLNELSHIIQEPELYLKYWQEIAIRKYNENYIHRFSSRNYLQLLNHVFILFRKYLGRKPSYSTVIDSKNIHVDDLILLNIIRNESHSWTIKRALSIITQQESDWRTADTKQYIDKLLRRGKDDKYIS